MSAGFGRWRYATRWLRLLAALFVLTLSLPCSAPPLCAAAAPEYQVKAAFLFNFAQFVEWPAEAFSSPDAPLCIAILGRDPFGEHLNQIVEDEQVGGRPLHVRRVTRIEEAYDCHILFISRSERSRMRQLLQQLRQRPILSVADTRGFAEAGGIIGMVMESNRVRLRVNTEAAEAAGLRISSKLLRTAYIAQRGATR